MAELDCVEESQKKYLEESFHEDVQESQPECLGLEQFDEQDQENLIWYLGVLSRSCREVMGSAYFDQYYLLRRSAKLTPDGQRALDKITSIFDEVSRLKKAVHWLMNIIGLQMVASGRFQIFEYGFMRNRPDLVRVLIGNEYSTYEICVPVVLQSVYPVNGVRKADLSKEKINFMARGLDHNFEAVRDLALKKYSEYQK